MPGENMGDLYYSLRAKLDQWQRDLAQADQFYMSMRRRWEEPVRLAGMQQTGGGVLGNAGNAVAPGPNIADKTSNGDVTWRLQDAMDRHQVKGDNAMSVARSLMRAPRARAGGGGDDEDEGGGGSAGGRIDPGVMAEARATKRAAEAEARTFRVRRALEMQNQVDISDFNKRQTEREQAAWGPIRAAEEAEAGKGKAAGGSLLTSKLGHTAIKSFVATMVVDAIASELNNTENYRQGIRLAGQHSTDIVRADVRAATHPYGAIPIVGGLIDSTLNAANGLLGRPTEQSMNADLDLIDRQDQINAAQYGAGIRTAGMMAADRASRRGPIGRLIETSRMGRIAGEASINERYAELRKTAKYDVGALDPSNPEDYWKLEDSEKSFVGTMEAGSYRMMSRFGLGFLSDPMETKNDIARAMDRRQQLNSESEVGMAASQRAELAAQRKIANDDVEEGRRTLRFQNIGDESSIHLMQMQNSFRPVTGQANYIKETSMLKSAYLLRDGATPEEQEQAGNTLRMGEEELKGMRASIQQNLLYGHGQQYDPYVASPLEFQDRNPESQADQLSSIDKNIAVIASFLERNFPGGGGIPKPNGG